MSLRHIYKAAKSVFTRLSAALFALMMLTFMAAAMTGCGINILPWLGSEPAETSDDTPAETSADLTPRGTEAATTEPELTEAEKGFWKQAEEYLDYYCEVALDSEFGDSDGKVHRWTEPVSLYVCPSEDAEKYDDFLKEHIKFLNGIDEFPGIIFTDSPDAAALTLEFVTAEKMKTVTGSGKGEAYGFTRISWYNKDGRIFKGNIYIVREEDCSEADVKHTLTEETVQAMGLMNDSLKYPDSIFYQDYSEICEISEIDAVLLRMHYSEYVTAGMNENQVRETVRRLAN